MMPFWETDRVKYIVALAGNIGAGKSSLTSRLAQRLGWEPIFERKDSGQCHWDEGGKASPPNS